MIYKSGSRVVQKVIQTACKSRPNVIQKVVKSRQTMSHMVCHTATGGPARSRSHDGFPIGKAREACGIGYVFVLCFCSYFRSFLLACFGCCRAFLASISRPRSSFFNVFGMVFDAPRCGIVIVFLDLPLRTGWFTKVAPESSKK